MSDEGIGMPMGKRVGPEDVPPLTLGKIRYEVIHWGKDRGLGQNGGYIAAIDGDSDAELWTLKIYNIDYDPVMEEDVQEQTLIHEICHVIVDDLALPNAERIIAGLGIGFYTVLKDNQLV